MPRKLATAVRCRRTPLVSMIEALAPSTIQSQLLRNQHRRVPFSAIAQPELPRETPEVMTIAETLKLDEE